MALVLFSGGCDSTLLLYDLALDMQRGRIPQSIITAISITHTNLPSDTQQKFARDKIRKAFAQRELHINWVDVEVKLTGSFITNAGCGGLSHPVIWSSLSLLHAESKDMLYFGYHSGDDFWVKQVYFESSVKQMCIVCGKDVDFKYPLEFKDKSQIIVDLKNKGLYEYCWWCETIEEDRTEPCGKCLPCKTHLTALWKIETFKEDYWLNGDPRLSVPILSNNLVSSEVGCVTSQLKGS